MSSRTSRSASIPIPGSMSRSIEDFISVPFSTTHSARARLVSGTRLHVPTSPERPLHGRSAVSASPVRTLSGGYAAALGRPAVPHTASVPVFEPRIITTATPPRGSEPGCAPTPTTAPQSTPSRARRASVRRQSTTGTPSAAPSTPRAAPPASSPAPSAPTAFPRPAYLEQSALRDLLFTDAPPVHAATTLVEHVVAGGPAPAPSSRMGTPVPVPYPYLRREVTPGMETDDESNVSASPPPAVRATPAPAPGALLINPALRLPTKWSEQDRHHLLTVSADGRDLTFYGALCSAKLAVACSPEAGQSCIGDRDSAAARANHPIPPACGIYYYEVEILQKGTKGCAYIAFLKDFD